MPTTSKATQLSRLKSLSIAMPKHCATMTFTVAGTTYTTPQVVQVADALLASDDATVKAKLGYESAEAAEKKLFSADMALITAVRENLELALSNSPATLAELGIAPRKARKPASPEALVARSAKAKATRLARGTTSKQQKAKLHGNVSGVTITPIVTGEPATETTPAATSTSASSPASPATATGGASGGVGLGAHV